MPKRRVSSRRISPAWPNRSMSLQCPSPLLNRRVSLLYSTTEYLQAQPQSSLLRVSLPCPGAPIAHCNEKSKPHTNHPTTPTVVLGMYSCSVCRLAQRFKLHADTCSILLSEVVDDASKLHNLEVRMFEVENFSQQLWLEDFGWKDMSCSAHRKKKAMLLSRLDANLI